MAKQQRLPFEWSGRDEGRTDPEEVRIKPMDAQGSQPPPAEFELQAEGTPVPEAPQPPPPRAPVVRVRMVPKPSDELREEIAEIGDDDVPMSLGQVLIDARSNAALSISEVSDRTKVPPAFIEAAENERYEDFPADLYARGHLAKLCAAYKIPAGPVMTLYKSCAGGGVVQKEDDASLRNPHRGGASKLSTQASQYRPVIQTESASIGVGHRLTTTIVLLALSLLVALVLAAFGITAYHNSRLNREDDNLGPDPNATSSLAMEEFIVPQPLPLKEIAMPDRMAE